MAKIHDFLNVLFSQAITKEELAQYLGDYINANIDESKAAALKGSEGEPGPENRYVTEKDLRLPSMMQALALKGSEGDLSPENRLVTEKDLRLPTIEQIEALQGSEGEPGPENRLVTEQDLRLPTIEQTLALQGTSGIPSAENSFVTTEDPRNVDARKALPHVHQVADLPNKFTTIIKPIDTTITRNSNLNDDLHLLFPMTANTNYVFRLKAFFDTDVVSGFKYRHTGPTDPTLVRILCKEIAPAALIEAMRIDIGYSLVDWTITSLLDKTGGLVTMEGIIQNGENDGDFVFRWAQNISSDNATTVLAGSFIEWALA